MFHNLLNQSRDIEMARNVVVFWGEETEDAGFSYYRGLKTTFDKINSILWKTNYISFTIPSPWARLGRNAQAKHYKISGI